MTILYLSNENDKNSKPNWIDMRYRILFFTILITLCLNVLAQNKTQESLAISTDFETEFVLDSIELADTLPELFPADDLYKNLWNCTNIKYPKTDFARQNDTIVFTLVGPDEHPFVPPFKGKVISKFGPRHGRMHTGTDVKLHLGDSVLCAFDGKVRLARRFSGYGNMVLVRHNNGIETIYAHLKTISVKVNDPIKAGDLIGLGGRTGRATTEHLHFETRIFGDPFDPNKYIDFENFTLRSEHIYYKNKKIYIDLDKINTEPEKAPAQQLAAKAGAAKPKSDSPAAAVTTAQTNTDGPIRHIIRSGDNLWTLAKQYNTTVKSICEINKITVNQILKIGTILSIQ